MKRIIYTFLAMAILTFATSQPTAAKRVVVPEMYMFGFAASFNDTIVYFTDIQRIDSAWIEKGSKFLQSRNVYSSQLKNYLTAQLNMPHRTCVVFFNKSRAKVEKQFVKMRRKYGPQKDGRERFELRYISEQDFKFKSTDLTGLDEEEKAQAAEAEIQARENAKAQKAERKAKKKEQKAAKRGK